MKLEDREGLRLQIHDLEAGLQKIVATNLPMPLTWYIDNEAKQLTAKYFPEIIPSTIGNAFPVDDYRQEQVVHPLVAASLLVGRFGGVTAEHYPTIVAWCNHYLSGGFFTTYDKNVLEQAVTDEYVRNAIIEKETVYFPTEKSVRAMCDTRLEVADMMLGLHTGVQFVITGHMKLPDYAGD
ncbi:hypothetical protein COU56_04950 [Candidatus Pacearchaeota archaeon CG10_big_fil_rev_8_21_14_0_10_31_9]|nr:MAG: hypothetical protein COU56_04950 [Candidatus Pacearchaeota archaeon CG10_big_fil_rev_8_21_14_0_10_31_9]